MTKPLPHRKSTGECRDCGMIQPSSAPTTCCRCALEIMSNAGHHVQLSPAQLFADFGWEMWRVAAHDMRRGKLKSDRFHLYVGHADGGPLEPAPAEIVGDWQVPTRVAAQALGGHLADRYPQVWVVTTVGSWNAVKTD